MELVEEGNAHKLSCLDSSHGILIPFWMRNLLLVGQAYIVNDTLRGHALFSYRLRKKKKKK